MTLIEKTELSNSDKQQLLALWNKEYPAQLNYKSFTEFDRYLNTLAELSHVLVINNEHEIIGWYFDFIRQGEIWFAIILDSLYQGKGLGTKLLNCAKEKEPVLNGWVIDHNNDRKTNGQLYQSPLKFYLKNDFETLADERLDLDIISAVRIRWCK